MKMTEVFLGAFLLLSACIRADEGNMIRNADFSQTDPDGRPAQWSGKLPEGSGAVRDAGPEGTGALHLDHTGQMVWQTVKVEAGRSYEIRYFLKTDFPKWLSAASFQVLWMDSQRKPLFTDYKGKKVWDMTIRNVQGTRDWQEMDFGECIAPKNAAWAQIRLCIAFDRDGACWFTRLSMKEKSQGDSFANRVNTIPYRSGEIPMEDFFNRKYWQESVVFQNFLIPTANSPAKNQTSAECFYTDEALYLNIRCGLPNADQVKIDPKSAFSTQESCEVFFQLPGAENHYHIFATADGKIRCRTETWNDGSWPLKGYPWKGEEPKSAVEYTQDAWRLGLRIPFRSLDRGTPAEGESWRMNLCRGNYGKDKELSAWSALREAHFQFPGGFGKVFFRKNVPLLRAAHIDVNGAVLQLKNPTDREIRLRAAFVKHAGETSGEVAVKEISLAPGREDSFSFPQKTLNSDLRFLEIRQDGVLLAKHCNMPSDKYYAFGIFDPEGVRGRTLNIAVDHPFFLGLNMRHNAEGKTKHRVIERKEKAFDLYLEVPDGLNFREMIFDAGEWRQTPFVKPEKTPFERNGTAMIRYRFELPLIINWASPSFLFFYDCSLPEGKEYPLQWYLTENGTRLPGGEMSFRTIRMGSIERLPKRFANDMFYIDAKIIRHLFPEDTLKHYTRLGMNRITVNVLKGKNQGLFSGTDPKTTEDYYDLLFREMEKTGIRLYFTSNSSSATPQAWYWTDKDPDARALGADGKDAPRTQYNYPPLCPTYRGKFFQAHAEKLRSSFLFSKYKCTWLTLDLELWPPSVWEKICFCERCLNKFREFARAHHPQYENSPVREMFLAGTDKDFMNVWEEYKGFVHRQFIEDLTAPVRSAAAGNPSSSPRPNFLIGEWCKPRAHLMDTIDFFEMGLYYTPDVVYTHFEEVYRKWGDKRKNWYPTFTFGQTAACPDFHMKAEQLPELVYEAAIYGAQGICWYFYAFVEPLRWKNILDALRVIIPYEDIILDGSIIADAATDNPKTQLTARTLGGEGLLAIRAYKADSAQTARITLPVKGASLDVYDCISGEKIAELTPEKPSFSCTVEKNRCRLLYFGRSDLHEKRMRGE